MSDLNSHAITTVARYKSYAGITDNTQDEIITLLINAVTEFIENQTGRRIKETVYTNKLINGSGNGILQLLAFPVSTSAGFSIQYKTDTDSWDTLDSDTYEIDYEAGIVRLKGSIFSQGYSNYRVSFTGGYSNIPVQVADLEFASWRLIKTALSKRTGVEGISQQSLGSYSVVFSDSYFLNKEVKGIVEQYRVYNV